MRIDAAKRWGMRVLGGVAAACAAAPLAGQAAGLPFSPGETCVYRGSNVLGRIGTGTMKVEAGEGGDYLLRFDFRGRVGLVGVEDHTRSYFDPRARASVRYTKRERSPLASRDEDVRMDVAARRWSDGERSGPMPTSAPLDELSFLYFVRTLPLEDGDEYDLARMYDAARNPVSIRVVGRRTMQVPAGRFRTVEVEMRVRDPERYRGGVGLIRLHLSDDHRRALVRMESPIPRAGRMVLSLESGSGGCSTAHLARAD